MKLYLVVLFCILCNVSAQLALKKGANVGDGLFDDPTNLSLWAETLLSSPVLVGITLWTISTLLWIYVLSGSDLSYAYALYGLNYVLTPLAASWCFGEQLNPTQLIGMALITLGVGLTVTGKVIS